MDLPEKINILVVDDDPDMGVLIQKYLSNIEKIDHVYWKQTTPEARQILQSVNVSLMIVDHHLATDADRKTDGVHFIDMIIHTNTRDTMKFLLISGNLEKEDYPMAFGVIGSNILKKPFSKEKLLQKLSQILKIELA
ncbi:MAG: hypothetical protein A2X86_14735 [Bdellovibrionales bacterium GWA2_49_15]|nr:MAG: hypothetical protein A2X86_14735 [Bdellovibrionales bacterium GWA2_49_15]HAZ13403.1 hypothetical protein [Bdellovibrionales bacterium]